MAFDIASELQERFAAGWMSEYVSLSYMLAPNFHQTTVVVKVG